MAARSASMLVVVACALALVAMAALVYRALRRERPPAPAPAAAPAAASPAPAPSAEEARIEAFWAWWRTAGPRLAGELDARRAEGIAEEVSARVDALDPGLQWETGPGLHGARHHLAISGAGDRALRVLAERWRARAPAGDAAWEFYPARQPLPGPQAWNVALAGADGRVEFAAFRLVLEVDAAREVIDVTLHHPAFRRLSEERRRVVAYLALDNLLGEDGVERWIGWVRFPAEAAPPGGVRLEKLRAEVEALARRATGERFALIRRAAPGAREVILANVSLKPIDHLLMDGQLTVTIALLQPTPAGMPDDDEAEALNRMEDALLPALGHEAVYLGRTTGGGLRKLYFHVAAGGPAPERVRAWARAHPAYLVQLEERHDPEWALWRQWRSAVPAERSPERVH